MGDMVNGYKTSVITPESKTPLGRPERRWENNIKIHLKEIGCEPVNCIQVIQYNFKLQALVKTYNETSGSKKKFLSSKITKFTRRALLHGVS
jgi:hypothetical protein